MTDNQMLLDEVILEQQQQIKKEENKMIDDLVAKRNEERKQNSMTANEKLKKMYPDLVKPFPKHAHQPYKVGSQTFTTIKAQFVVNRLNEVLGVDGWQFEVTERDRIDNDVIVHGMLVVKDLETGRPAAIRQSSGGATMHYSKPYKNDDPKTFVPKPMGSWADKFKSAETDALSKAASHIGIGNDVFMGLVNPDGSYKEVAFEEQDNTKPALAAGAKKTSVPAKKTVSKKPSSFGKKTTTKKTSLSI